MSSPNNKKDMYAADERTSLLAGSSAINPPPAYSLEAPEASTSVQIYPATGSSSNATLQEPAAAPLQQQPSAQPQPTIVPLYPALPPSSPSHPVGPSPLRSLPPPVLISREDHYRAADRRARRRFFSALLVGAIIYIVLINIAQAPELEPVRRESGKALHRAWKSIKRGWRKLTEWEENQHIGDKVGKIIHPTRRGPVDPIETVWAYSERPATTEPVQPGYFQEA
ncbi:hypothetical protein T439DRAFT_325712 [Meredithblackwellia eburnea MCA 4105]